jgi:DNA-binding GntR family transcriptional regulator
MPLTTESNVTRRLLRDDVFDALSSAIRGGTLVPGEILRDEELMVWLGTSRSPIREALARLSELGLVELPPNKPARVAPLDFRTVNEAMFVSGVLHESSVRAALATISDAELGALRVDWIRVQAAAKDKDIATLGPAIGDFFLHFERATHNPLLVTAVDSLTFQLLRFLYPREELTDLSVIVERLGEIHDAAQLRNVEQVASLIHALYEPTRRNFLTTYRDVP